MTVSLRGSTVAPGEMDGVPLWRGTALNADCWRSELGASKYLTLAIRYGVMDMPTVPFTEGLILGDLPQSTEDREFARSDLERGCRESVYEEITREEAYRLARKGHMISSAFTV